MRKTIVPPPDEVKGRSPVGRVVIDKRKDCGFHGAMIWIVIKIIITLALSAGTWALCRAILVAPLIPVFLVLWGGVCFFLGYDAMQWVEGIGLEDAGRMKAENTTAKIFWKLAGVLSWLLATGVVSYLFD